MFKAKPNYTKLKTNLKLSMNRLKLLEKQKSALSLQSRKEIANYAISGKIDRAKIRLEHIIRDDYLVEAMELLELFCDLILARFGLVEQMNELDDGLAEAISSLIWAAPRLQSDVPELRVVSQILTAKYGKPYLDACVNNDVGTVSPKLMHKMSVHAPPKITIEKYLIEIAKYYNFEYTPDEQIMKNDEVFMADNLLISIDDPGEPPAAPTQLHTEQSPFKDMKNGVNNNSGKNIAKSGIGSGGFAYPIRDGRPPFVSGEELQPSTSSVSDKLSAYPDVPSKDQEASSSAHTPATDELAGPPPAYTPPGYDTLLSDGGLPDLPSVPPPSSDKRQNASGETPAVKSGDDADDDEIDFDDLTRRFEELKRKK